MRNFKIKTRAQNLHDCRRQKTTETPPETGKPRHVIDTSGCREIQRPINELETHRREIDSKSQDTELKSTWNVPEINYYTCAG